MIHYSDNLLMDQYMKKEVLFLTLILHLMLKRMRKRANRLKFLNQRLKKINKKSSAIIQRISVDTSQRKLSDSI